MCTIWYWTWYCTSNLYFHLRLLVRFFFWPRKKLHPQWNTAWAFSQKHDWWNIHTVRRFINVLLLFAFQREERYGIKVTNCSFKEKKDRKRKWLNVCISDCDHFLSTIIGSLSVNFSCGFKFRITTYSICHAAASYLKGKILIPTLSRSHFWRL